MSSAEAIDEKKWRHLDETVVESFFDRARQNLHCRIACGGVKCKHEDYSLYLERTPKPAVHGLNSNWVGDLIVASQRPSTTLFGKFNLIQQFNEKKITGVFNLQEKGEHAFCGPDGIFSDCGYSYNGERDLMRFGVSYYEFPWPDMTAPENDIVFRSVQCMDSHIKKLGKVLVHCHAGLGRTGLMIACYFILCQHMSAKSAIDLVRSSRPGAVQTSRQVAFVEGFEKFSRALGFTMKRSPKDPFLDFSSYMKRQYEFLHGDDSKTYRFVPYHIHQILCRVIDLASTGGRNAANEALMSFSLSNEPSAAVVDACRAEINQRKYDPEKTSNIALLVFLVLDWFRSMDTPFFAREHAAMFLRGLKDPRKFIRNIATMQRAALQKHKQQQQQLKPALLIGGTTLITQQHQTPLSTPSEIISIHSPPVANSSIGDSTSTPQLQDQGQEDLKPSTINNNNDTQKQQQQLTINVPTPLSSTSNSSTYQQQHQPTPTTVVVPPSTPFALKNSTYNNSGSIANVGNNNNNTTTFSPAATGSTHPDLTISTSSINNTFRRKPRIPWILQNEVEEQLPREVRHTAALVLSAIATLTAEASPISSLLDVAIQSTVDAFTLNLPPDAFHTFYYKKPKGKMMSDTNNNNEKSASSSDDDDDEYKKSTKKKLYTMTETDRRLLYEAFTRWCAHEHSTYFDVFSTGGGVGNNSMGTMTMMMGGNTPTNNNNNTDAEGGAMDDKTTRRDRQDQRVISGLQSAAETRLQNYSNKVNNALSNINSRSVTPQLSPKMLSNNNSSAVGSTTIASVTLSEQLRKENESNQQQEIIAGGASATPRQISVLENNNSSNSNNRNHQKSNNNVVVSGGYETPGGGPDSSSPPRDIHSTLKNLDDATGGTQQQQQMTARKGESPSGDSEIAEETIE